MLLAGHLLSNSIGCFAEGVIVVVSGLVISPKGCARNATRSSVEVALSSSSLQSNAALIMDQQFLSKDSKPGKRHMGIPGKQIGQVQVGPTAIWVHKQEARLHEASGKQEPCCTLRCQQASGFTRQATNAFKRQKVKNSTRQMGL